MARIRTKAAEYYYLTMPPGCPKQYGRVEKVLVDRGIASDVAISTSGCRAYRINRAYADRLPGAYPKHGLPLEVTTAAWRDTLYRENPIPVIYKNWKPICSGTELQSTSKRRRTRHAAIS
jgi:hypothetical protein